MVGEGEGGRRTKSFMIVKDEITIDTQRFHLFINTSNWFPSCSIQVFSPLSPHSLQISSAPTGCSITGRAYPAL
jgi:hypothetical protein